jgi:hypothetical protein
VGWDWVHLVCQPLIGLLFHLQLTDEYGSVGGMGIGRGKPCIQRKPAPVPLCPPQIPHKLTWDWTQAAMVGSPHLAACFSKASPSILLFHSLKIHLVILLLSFYMPNVSVKHLVSSKVIATFGRQPYCTNKLRSVSSSLELPCSHYYCRCTLVYGCL